MPCHRAAVWMTSATSYSSHRTTGGGGVWPYPHGIGCLTPCKIIILGDKSIPHAQGGWSVRDPDPKPPLQTPQNFRPRPSPL